MRPSTLFTWIKNNQALCLTSGIAAIVVGATIKSVLPPVLTTSDGADAGITKALNEANAEKMRNGEMLLRQFPFTNTVSGTKGKFEILARVPQEEGPPCYTLAITGGDATSGAKSGGMDVAKVRKFCPASAH